MEEGALRPAAAVARITPPPVAIAHARFLLFTSFLPSFIRFSPLAAPLSSLPPDPPPLAQPAGALGADSIPALGEDYASPSLKRELSRLFQRNGCHHCGTRRGPVIGDHMPPNKLAAEAARRSRPAGPLGDLMRQARARVRPGPPTRGPFPPFHAAAAARFVFSFCFCACGANSNPP